MNRRMNQRECASSTRVDNPFLSQRAQETREKKVNETLHLFVVVLHQVDTGYTYRAGY